MISGLVDTYYFPTTTVPSPISIPTSLASGEAFNHLVLLLLPSRCVIQTDQSNARFLC